MNQFGLWIIFGTIITVMLALDLGVFHRRTHEVSMKEALTWSAVWIGLALLFCGGVHFVKGPDAALKFLTGYLLEESLSVDNLFVFLVIFSYFKVPRQLQHTALFWGIVGAMIMRMIFIAVGVSLITRFSWIMYIFGIFLLFTAIKLVIEKEKEIEPEKNFLIRLFKRFMGVTETYEGNKFFIRKDGRTWATPLFIVLIIIETTDVVFALDSIPAILAVTTDPFIVYTSNIFAILGLRSLFFALSGLMQMFHFLNYGLALILAFIGVKMLVSGHYHIPIGAALGFIVVTLAASVAISLLFPKKLND